MRRISPKPGSSLLLRLLVALGTVKLCLAVYLLLCPGGPASPGQAQADPTPGAGRPSATAGAPAPKASRPGGCNPELLDIIQAEARQWRHRKEELDAKQKDLELLRSEIDERIKELKSLQSRLEGPAKKAKSAYDARFQHLVGVYSSMEPSRAALLLDKMDEDTVAKIFSTMKSKKVANILALMAPEKAARITDKLSAQTPRK